MNQPRMTHPTDASNLADILERVLDKGIVIAGDISIKIADIELLSIRIRLLIASVDKAKEMGINWWEHDPTLSNPSAQQLPNPQQESLRLEQEQARLEAQLEAQRKNESLKEIIRQLEEKIKRYE